MKEFLNSYRFLQDSEIDEVAKFATTKHLKKGEYFIRQGEVCKEVAFVKSGIFRNFIISNLGEESTYCITLPNNSISSYTSYITGDATIENIQAIANSEIFILSKEVLDKAINESNNWMKYMKIVSETEYMKLEKRVFSFVSEKAKQRYISLLEQNPIYIQQIPLQYLASYLGITQRHLSRLRREVMQGGQERNGV
jgi:CRP-like cAMP-binding protein